MFSDKTGTLTANIMEFVKFSAGATGYGTGKEPTEKQEKNVRFNDSKVEETLMKKDDDNEEYK